MLEAVVAAEVRVLSNQHKMIASPDQTCGGAENDKHDSQAGPRKSWHFPNKIKVI